jgi:hypothetical protein
MQWCGVDLSEQTDQNLPPPCSLSPAKQLSCNTLWLAAFGQPAGVLDCNPKTGSYAVKQAQERCDAAKSSDPAALTSSPDCKKMAAYGYTFRLNGDWEYDDNIGCGWQMLSDCTQMQLELHQYAPMELTPAADNTKILTRHEFMLDAGFTGTYYSSMQFHGTYSPIQIATQSGGITSLSIIKQWEVNTPVVPGFGVNMTHNDQTDYPDFEVVLQLSGTFDSTTTTNFNRNFVVEAQISDDSPPGTL